MTSTLPNFVSSPANPTGAALSLSAAQAGLTSLSEGVAEGPGEGSAIEFAQLLNSVPTAEVQPRVTPGSIRGMALSKVQSEDLTTEVSFQSEMSLEGQAVTAGEPASLATESAQEAPSERSNLRIRGEAISRPALEHAAAFAATLLHTLFPAPQPTVPEDTMGSPDMMPGSATETIAVTEGMETISSTGAQEAAAGKVLPNGRFFPGQVPEQADPVLGERRSEKAKISAERDGAAAIVGSTFENPESAVVLPNGRLFPGKALSHAEPALGSNQFKSVSTTASSRTDNPDETNPNDLTATADISQSAPASALSSANPQAPVIEFNLSEDGTLEGNLVLDQTPALDDEAEESLATPVEIQAELQAPGQPLVRLSLRATATVKTGNATQGVKIAGQKGWEKKHLETTENGIRKNFYSNDLESVVNASKTDGITVANSGSNMPVVLKEEVSSTRNPGNWSALSDRMEIPSTDSAVWNESEVKNGFAENKVASRAVATVTSLADAQFSASMQKAGSVQLRLKFGGEDLSVRVELRDGVVHTDFRTDSPELREAIMREWQAVSASSPGHGQRYLDPVFSQTSRSLPSADAGSQQQSFHRSSQQQSADQWGAREQAWSSQSPFARRSALSESFIPAPVAPRLPVFLPTSLRLSALA